MFLEPLVFALPEPSVPAILSSCFGTIIAFQYAFATNKPVASFLSKNITRDSTWKQRIEALIYNMVLAFLASWILYEATSMQQYAIASASFVAIISGYKTLKSARWEGS